MTRRRVKGSVIALVGAAIALGSASISLADSCTDIGTKIVSQDKGPLPLRVTEIQKAYPELVALSPADEQKIVSLISKLEDEGVPQFKIKEALKKAGTQCSIR